MTRVMAVKRVTCFRCLLLLFCLSGFSAQQYQVAIRFFSYATSSVSRQDVERLIRQTATEICFLIHDVIDQRRLRRETGIPYHKDGDFLLLTVSQMLQFTPTQRELLTECGYRDAEGVYGFTQDCEAHFDVMRYYTMEYICYAIHPISNVSFPSQRITSSTSYTLEMYQFALHPRFAKSPQMYVTLFYDRLNHTRHPFPYVSRQYSTFSFDSLRPERNGSREQNVIHLTNAVVQESSLPPPFDTRCRHAHVNEYYECKSRCIASSMTSFNRTPPSRAYREGVDLRVPGPDVLRDERFKRVIKLADQKCERHCFFTPCELEYSITSITSSHDENGFIVGVLVPQFGRRTTTVYASMTFVEFFSFLTSGFGTWFGISFLSLDPSRLRLPGAAVAPEAAATRLIERKSAARRSLHQRKETHHYVHHEHHIHHHHHHTYRLSGENR